MLTGEVAEMVKGATGLSDEEVSRIHPGIEKLFTQAPKTMQYEVIAEVAKSNHCFAQVKVGDKLVFDPFLNPEKSVGVMCPRALLPVMVQINSLWEMIAEWSDSGKENEPEIVFRNVRCLDPGLDDGGVGGVIYQIRAQKMGS
ncbi:hypothetical protein ACFL0Q_01730 [Thermodesulfobacteriota bacterium]